MEKNGKYLRKKTGNIYVPHILITFQNNQNLKRRAETMKENRSTP